MRLFHGRGQQPHHLLPSDIVSLLEMFGRGEFDPRGTGVAREVDPLRKGRIEADLYQVAQADPDAFVTALAEAVLPVRGWAAYGASRLIGSLLGREYTHPESDAILTAALEWLRDNGVPPMRVASYEWEFWLAHGGKTEPWLTPWPGYRPEEAPISDLRIGEMRRVAQLTASPDSNVIYVRRNDDHEYVMIVDAPHSEDDPRRGQFETVRAETLRGLYTKMGAGLEMLPYWCDNELASFIPYGRPRIPVL